MTTEVKVVTSGVVIVKNANPPVEMTNTCGIGNHTIQEIFFIIFKNCSIQIDKEILENFQHETQSKFEVLPFFEMKIHQKNLEPLTNLHSLQALHLKKCQKLEKMHDITIDVQLSSSLIIIGFVFTFTILCTIGTFASIKYRNRDVSNLKREEKTNQQQHQKYRANDCLALSKNETFRLIFINLIPFYSISFSFFFIYNCSNRNCLDSQRAGLLHSKSAAT